MGNHSHRVVLTALRMKISESQGTASFFIFHRSSTSNSEIFPVSRRNGSFGYESRLELLIGHFATLSGNKFLMFLDDRTIQIIQWVNEQCIRLRKAADQFDCPLFHFLKP
jgi:hypothetical protein